MAARAAALDWLFPHRCALCGEPGDALCGPCLHDVSVPLDDCCPRCALPFVPGTRATLCGRCIRRPPTFDASIAAALYRPPFDRLIQDLKYGARLHHGPLFADLLVARWTRANTTCDRLIPVPLSRGRMSERGFNQSAVIARHVARRIGVPLDDASVLRVHDTAPQAALPFDERRRNVRGAFAVIDARRAALAGRRIGVIDDVMTTGATLDALAATLKRAGAVHVVNLVVARTP